MKKTNKNNKKNNKKPGKVDKIKKKVGKTLYDKLKKTGLSIKEISFTVEYLTNGYNGTQAYLSTIAKKGTSPTTANVECHRYLRKPSVQKAIKEIFDEWLGEKKLKLEKEIIDVLYKRAFYDISIFQTALGQWKKLSDIPEEWHCCIDGTDVKYYGKDANIKVVTLKLANKDIALDKLDKFIGLTKESKDITMDISEETIHMLKDVFNSRKKNKEKKKDDSD